MQRMIFHVTCSPSVVKLLLERGASTSWTDVRGNTYLHMAVSSYKFELAELLIHHGCAIDSANSFKDTCLHLACSNADVPMIKMLVKNHANMFLKDINDKFPFFNLAVKCTRFKSPNDA